MVILGSKVSLLNKKEFSTGCPIKSVFLIVFISVIFTDNQKIQKVQTSNTFISNATDLVFFYDW